MHILVFIIKEWTINMSPAFGGMVMEAFLGYSVLGLAKLYDIDKSAVSIEKYINYVEQNSKSIYGDEIDKKFLLEIKRMHKCYEDKSEIINKLKNVRDKSVAHNDKSIIIHSIDVYKKNNFIIKEIHSLIDFVKEIVNVFWGKYSNTEEVLEAINKDDFEIVFRALESYKNIV